MQPLVIQRSELAQAMQLDWGERLAKKRFWLLIFASLMILISFYLAWCSYEQDVDNKFGAIFFVIGVMIVLLPFLMQLLSKMISKNYDKSGLFAHTYNIQWDAQYLYFTSKDAETKIAWSAFLRLLENDALLLLYTHNRVYQLFPKRIFDSVQELDDFRQYAQRGIENQR